MGPNVLTRPLLASLAIALLAGATSGSASDCYYVDPIVSANIRIVDKIISQDGATLEVPTSDGIAAELTYPANDACSGTTLHASGLGPAAVKRVQFSHSIYSADVPGWIPFYSLRIALTSSCGQEWITFRGFPKLRLRIPGAKTGTVYYMDLAIENGNDTHIPLGPPDERDATNISFDFSELPFWAKSEQQLRIPSGVAYYLIAVRQ